MWRPAAGAADDVELVVVESERERLDAHRAARTVEASVLDGQPAAPLKRIDDFVQQVLILGKGLLAPAHEEDELPARILEALRIERGAADRVDEVVHAGLLAGPLEEPCQAGADAGDDGGRDPQPCRSAGHPRAVDADVQAPLSP